MAFKIVAVDIVASYDAMTRSPGEMRPLPAQVSARLFEEMSKDVLLQLVIHDAQHATLVYTDLTSALHEARTKVQQYMNQRIVDQRVQGIVVDAATPHYIPTSSGGHITFTWLKVGKGKSESSFWSYNFEMQGEMINAYACVSITLAELDATSTPGTGTTGGGAVSSTTTTTTTATDHTRHTGGGN